jgi:hypothetical protein
MYAVTYTRAGNMYTVFVLHVANVMAIVMSIQEREGHLVGSMNTL